jgi:hypothetical protein
VHKGRLTGGGLAMSASSKQCQQVGCLLKGWACKLQQGLSLRQLNHWESWRRGLLYIPIKISFFGEKMETKIDKYFVFANKLKIWRLKMTIFQYCKIFV